MSVYYNQYQNKLYGGRSSPVSNPLSGAQIEKNIEQQNALVKKWIPKVRRALKRSASKFTDGKQQGFVTRGREKGNVRGEMKLAKSITSKTGKQYGTIERVSFNFERHGVFVHKGVGRGYPISGKGKINNPSGKVRKPVEWFNPVLEKYIPELADRIADINADAAVNATRMKIN